MDILVGSTDIELDEVSGLHSYGASTVMARHCWTEDILD